MTAAISGYYAFMKTPWTLPIFQVSLLGYPTGTNIIYTDSIPLVAVVGRLIYQTTGNVANLYGIWTATCFIGSAASLTALVGLFGGRTLLCACATAVLGCSMPALIYRWGHLSLMAQYQVTLALAFYADCLRGRSPAWCLAISALLCLVSLGTHPYIFAMVTSLVLAAIIQNMVYRRLSLKAGLVVLSVLGVIIAGAIAASGHLSGGLPSSAGSSADGGGYGWFSLNLLSPIFPQLSGVLPFRIFAKVLDATGSQYEGFSYLGAGILLLIIFSAPDLGRWISRGWRTHIPLSLVLLGFALFAVTPNSCFGDWCVGVAPSAWRLSLWILEAGVIGVVVLIAAWRLLTVSPLFAAIWPAMLSIRLRHRGIANCLSLVGFVAFALIAVRCVGDWRIVTVQLPSKLVLSVIENFRSSGRFVWPLLYMVTAGAIALIATQHRFATVLLLVAVLLQWVDTAPLRGAFARLLKNPTRAVLDSTAWQTALADSAAVLVYPSFFCLPHSKPLPQAEVALELQLFAAVAGKPINSVYAARHQPDCTAEQVSARALHPVDGITVYLDTLPNFASIKNAAAKATNCQESERMIVCVPETISPFSRNLTDSSEGETK